MGHVKLTLSSSLLDARSEELATGHRVYWPIKAPAHAQRGGRAEHKGNVALRFKYFDGTRELPKGGSPRNQATARPASPAPPSALAQAAASSSVSPPPTGCALVRRSPGKSVFLGGTMDGRRPGARPSTLPGIMR